MSLIALRVGYHRHTRSQKVAHHRRVNAESLDDAVTREHAHADGQQLRFGPMSVNGRQTQSENNRSSYSHSHISQENNF
jgi:hypothetical protein